MQRGRSRGFGRNGGRDILCYIYTWRKKQANSQLVSVSLLPISESLLHPTSSQLPLAIFCCYQTSEFLLYVCTPYSLNAYVQPLKYIYSELNLSLDLIKFYYHVSSCCVISLSMFYTSLFLPSLVYQLLFLTFNLNALNQICSYYGIHLYFLKGSILFTLYSQF